MDAWLDTARQRIASTAGLDVADLGLSSSEVEALLDLARIAAHDSGDRTNAPLVCFLAGFALGRRPEVLFADVVAEAAPSAAE